MSHPRKFIWPGACAYALVLFGWIAPGITAANSTQAFSVRTWQTEDGLPANSIRAIAQTPDGYLWLGTSGGLVRFDGVQFTTFNRANSPGLASDVVMALAVDKKGALWLGTEEGLAHFVSGKFQSYDRRNGLVSDYVNVLCVDGEGVVWAGGPGGLNRIQDGVITTVKLGHGSPAILDMATDRAGRLWAMFAGTPLHVVENGGLVQRDLGLHVPRSSHKGFLEDSRGNIWVGSISLGLARWNSDQTTFYARTTEMPAADIFSRGIVEDASGNVWFSFPPVGLVRFADGKFDRLSPATGLPTGQVRVLFVDREDNLWVATADSGLCRIRPKLVENLNQGQGLRLYVPRAICDDGAGGLWIANEHDGLYRLHDGQFTQISGGAGGSLWTLFRNRQGALFGGKYPHGVAILGGRDPVSPPELEFRAAGHVEALLEDRSGTLWLGTENGVYRYRDRKLTSVTKQHGMVANDFACIIEDRENSIWAGALKGGIIRVKGETVTTFDGADGLRSDSVRCLLVDDDGALWAGTGNGLSRYEDGKFRTLGSAEGLQSEVINQLLDDGLGNLWAGSNMGIFRLQKKDLEACFSGAIWTVHPLRFGKEEGLLSLECRTGSHPTCVRAADGKLYFLTGKSIAVIDPKKISSNPIPPPVVIQKVTVDGNTGLSTISPEKAGSLVVQPGAFRLEFHFAGLSLSAPEGVRYRYRMEGYEDEWVEGGSRRFASYTRVPPGHYQFRVRCANSDGVWNEKEAAMAVTVQPQLWQTAWFKTVCGMALFAGAWLIYRQRIAQLERRRLAQEAFSRQLIESQEQERKRIAGELHDSLSQDLQLIRNRAQMALNFMTPTEKMAEQLNEISSASSNAIAQTRAISYALRPPELEHFGLTRAIESMVEKVGHAAGLEAAAEVESIDGLLEPGMEINFYRILQESLNNVVKHAQAKRVIVGIKRQASHIEASIFDDGRGFATNNGLNQDGKGRGSLGLTGMKERAAILGGTLQIQSTLGKGTRVTILLPVNSQANAS